MTNNTAHLFFSYAHADDSRMIPLHARMQAATGHNLWIDKVGLTRGTEWEDSIHRAIDASYGVIFAITRDFVDAKRVFIRDKEIPWTIDRFRKVQGPVIFPILFEDVTLPPDLDKALHDKDLQYLFHVLDFRDGDEKRLFEELKAVLPTPVAGNHPFIIDWPHLPNFQGRDELLIDLHDKLKGGAVGIHAIAGLHGMGGIGKTQLAVEYAHRYRFHYPAGVYWVNAARADWTAEVSEIAERLGLQPSDDSGRREALLANAFERHLKDLSGDALLILDNVENPADVTSRIIGSKLRFTDLPARLLITTRRQDLPDTFAALPVDVLPPEDARALLLTARPDASDDPAIDAICKALGYLPLALGWMAAALTELPDLKPDELLAELKTRGLDDIIQNLQEQRIDLRTPDYHTRLVTTALDWQVGHLQGDAPRMLLALIAAYGEAAVVPKERLRLLAGLTESAIRKPFTRGLHDLTAYSLVETLANGESFRLHPLTQHYAAHKLNAPDHLAECARRLLTAYRTPQTIYDQSARRGFGSLITDLQDTVSALSDPAVGTRHVVSLPDLQQGLNALARLFDWEGHHLRAWKPELPLPNPPRTQGGDSKRMLSDSDSPASLAGKGMGEGVNLYLIQSIRERAHHQADAALRDACDTWLAPHVHFQTDDAYRFPHDPALVRIFEGHTAGVNAASILPNGHQALSASADNTLRLWDIETGAELRRFEEYTSRGRAVAILPDGKRALSASLDNTLRLWDIDTGAELRRFVGHIAYVRLVVILPDGKCALSASLDNTLRLWDIDTGAELRRFVGHTNAVGAVAILPDGKRALSASDDGTLRLWDIETGTELRRFKGHTSYVSAVAILPDDRRALSASDDGTLRLWDIETGTELRCFKGHTDTVSAVAILPDGKRALSTSRDNTLCLWDIETGAEVRRLQGYTAYAKAVAILPDGKRALSASDDNTLHLWDIGLERSPQTEAEVRRFVGHTDTVSAVAILPDGKRALSASDDNILCLWDIETGAEVRRLQEYTAYARGVAIPPDGKRALSASSDNTLRLWDIASGAEVRRFKGHTYLVSAVAILLDGLRALSASLDNTLRLWDIETGAELRRFDGHTNAVSAVAILLDGLRVLSASLDNTLRLWDIETGAELRRFDGHTDWVSAVSILPDGQQALSASADKTLRLWDIETGAELRRFEGHTAWVSAVSILPDGKCALSASDDHTLRLWDIHSGLCRAILRLEEAPTCLAVIPPLYAMERGAGGEDVRIFLGSQSGKVRLIHLRLPPGS